MILSVASGKGGTGKTLIATSLALSLAPDQSIQFLDCDVEEPNAFLFLKPDLCEREIVAMNVPLIDNSKCTHCGLCASVCVYKCLAVLPDQVLLFSNLCHGCGACSYLCPEKAISEEGREIGLVEWGQTGGISHVHGVLTPGEAMSPPVIRQVKAKIDRDKLAIIDAPPGTSCPVVEAVKGSDFCILVTEPTPFGLNDLALAVETVRELKIPHGVVINRATDGNRLIENYCLNQNVPVLLTIPLDLEIARQYSNGITLAEAQPQWRPKFVGMYEQIKEILR